MADDSRAARLLAVSEEVGHKTLKTWAGMMLPGRALFDFSDAYAPGQELVKAGGSLAEALDKLAGPFVAAHLRQVSEPPGGSVALLLQPEESEESWPHKLEIYWRGAIGETPPRPAHRPPQAGRWRTAQRLAPPAGRGGGGGGCVAAV
jgi:hypothetical protein